MKTVKYMMLDGKMFSFGKPPSEEAFDSAKVGDTLTGKVANMVNIGPSLLRKAGGDQYIAESYSVMSVKVVGETTDSIYIDKVVYENGVWQNKGCRELARMLVVEKASEA